MLEASETESELTLPLELVKQIPKDGAEPLFGLSIALYHIVHVVPHTLPAPEPRFDPQSA